MSRCPTAHTSDVFAWLEVQFWAVRHGSNAFAVRLFHDETHLICSRDRMAKCVKAERGRRAAQLEQRPRWLAHGVGSFTTFMLDADLRSREFTEALDRIPRVRSRRKTA